ncbi:hypothetical protein C5C13_14145 [Clavibacter michiganensis]|nr:hypothetical protein C5C13_14145 [Clavibacter michiganensis]
MYFHSMQFRCDLQSFPRFVRLAVAARTRGASWSVDPRCDIVIFVDGRVAPILHGILDGRRGSGGDEEFRSRLLQRIDGLLDSDGRLHAPIESPTGAGDVHFPTWAVLNLLSHRAAADISRIALLSTRVGEVSIVDPEASMPVILDRPLAVLVKHYLTEEDPSVESREATANLRDYLEYFMSYAAVREGSSAVTFRPGPVVRAVRRLQRNLNVGR